MSTQLQTGSGVGFSGLLAVAFIVLKLTHAISWSWWWVLAPLWMPATVIVVFLGVVATAVAIAKYGK